MSHRVTWSVILLTVLVPETSDIFLSSSTNFWSFAFQRLIVAFLLQTLPQGSGTDNWKWMILFHHFKPMQQITMTAVLQTLCSKKSCWYVGSSGLKSYQSRNIFLRIIGGVGKLGLLMPISTTWFYFCWIWLTNWMHHFATHDEGNTNRCTSANGFFHSYSKFNNINFWRYSKNRGLFVIIHLLNFPCMYIFIESSKYIYCIKGMFLEGPEVIYTMLEAVDFNDADFDWEASEVLIPFKTQDLSGMEFDKKLLEASHEAFGWIWGAF